MRVLNYTCIFEEKKKEKKEKLDENLLKQTFLATTKYIKKIKCNAKLYLINYTHRSSYIKL